MRGCRLGTIRLSSAGEGTGKTHALLNLAETLNRQGQAAVYVDLRLLGSTGGIYSDAGVSVSEAGTRLLIDALSQVHDALVDDVLSVTRTPHRLAMLR